MIFISINYSFPFIFLGIILAFFMCMLYILSKLSSTFLTGVESLKELILSLMKINYEFLPLFVLGIILPILSYFLKKYTLGLCKKNIDLE